MRNSSSLENVFDRARFANLVLGIFVVCWLSLICEPGQAQTGGMQAQIPASEYNALVDLYNSTGGASWSNNAGWLDPKADSWDRIDLMFGHVAGIYLSGNHLVGTIPSSAGSFPAVFNFELADNQLTGNIPASLGSLSNAVWLYLDHNQLSGGIPDSLGNLTQLQELNLSANRLTGSIPDSFGNFGQLQRLDLSQNQLSGTIPSTLSNASSLNFIMLFDNQLSGSIPASLGDLPTTQYIDFHGNRLTGTIPDSLGGNLSLYWLDLGDNQLTGTIPSSIGTDPQLQYLDLSTNQLSGNIPAALGSLTYMIWLYLDGNQLSGTIPTNLGTLGSSFYGPLRSLGLSNNHLSGDVPDFSGFQHASLDFSFNDLNIAPGSRSFSNITAMIKAGNTVNFIPQHVSRGLTVGPIHFLSGAAPQVGLSGVVGQTYTIQASTDLTNWAALANVTLTNMTAQFLDASATNYPIRFYRAVVSQ